MAKDNLLVFGATGYIGKYIIERLVEGKESLGRISIFTSPQTAKTKPETLERLKRHGVEILIGDAMSDEDISNAYKNVNVVISAVGRNMIAEQINWVRLAAQVPSIKRFFPSEFGTDVEYGPESAREITHQQKLKVRAALQTSGTDYTYIVAGPYADAADPAYLSSFRAEPDVGSFDLAQSSAVVVGDGTSLISLTTPSDVGRMVFQALLHLDVCRNRALRVNSFTTTTQEIVEEFERQSGQTLAVRYTDLEQLRGLEKAAWANKHAMAPIFTLRRIWAEGGTLYKQRDNSLIDADDTETLADAVRAAIVYQKSGKREELKNKKFM